MRSQAGEFGVWLVKKPPNASKIPLTGRNLPIWTKYSESRRLNHDKYDQIYLAITKNYLQLLTSLGYATPTEKSLTL